MPKIPVISIVDDDESVRFSIAALVRSLGHVAHAFASAEDFLASSEASVTDCLVADIQMPGMSGIELQKRLATTGNRVPMIFVTAFSEDHISKQVLAGRDRSAQQAVRRRHARELHRNGLGVARIASGLGRGIVSAGGFGKNRRRCRQKDRPAPRLARGPIRITASRKYLYL